MKKKKIAVLFGGQSSEHEVSCMSAGNVIELIDQTRYDLILIGITKEGHWVKTDSVEEIRSGAWRAGKVSAFLLPDATKQCVLFQEGDETWEEHIDVVSTARTERFRVCLSLQRFHMWDVVFWRPQFRWINCIQRLSLTISVSVRQPIFR